MIDFDELLADETQEKMMEEIGGVINKYLGHRQDLHFAVLLNEASKQDKTLLVHMKWMLAMQAEPFKAAIMNTAKAILQQENGNEPPKYEA